MNKPYTVVGYEWQSNDIYGHNHEHATKPLSYQVSAETYGHAIHVAEVRHEEEFEESNAQCRNFTATLVIDGHPMIREVE